MTNDLSYPRSSLRRWGRYPATPINARATININIASTTFQYGTPTHPAHLPQLCPSQDARLESQSVILNMSARGATSATFFSQRAVPCTVEPCGIAELSNGVVELLGKPVDQVGQLFHYIRSTSG